jgi:hypothetical protein
MLVPSLGRTIPSHNYVFWLGDFNFRIDMDSTEVKGLVRTQDWATMYQVLVRTTQGYGLVWG